MKIVWIAQDLHIGGGQRVILELSYRLASRGHQIEIVYPKGRGGFQLPGSIKAKPVGLNVNSPILSLALNFPFTLAAIPLCDWLICSMPISALIGFIGGRLRQTQVMYYIMNDERMLFDDGSLMKSNTLLGAYHTFTDLVQRLPMTITVNSRWTANRVQYGKGCDYPIVPHGVDIEVFRPDGPQLKKETPLVIATVGRRHRWKGMDDLINALNTVHRKCTDDNHFTLWTITQDDLDFDKASFPVKKICPENDEQIASALRTADIFVHPSWFEGFGLPPLEAMACGTPAVITDSGGVNEFAKDGVNSLIVPTRDPSSLANAIEKMIKDAEIRKKLGQAGIETAQKFTWDHATDIMEGLLQSRR